MRTTGLGKEFAVTNLNLEQLRKQAKERASARRAAGEPITLSAAQFELAREHGFASWPRPSAVRSPPSESGWSAFVRATTTPSLKSLPCGASSAIVMPADEQARSLPPARQSPKRQAPNSSPTR